MEQGKENICANIYWIYLVVRLIVSPASALWMIDTACTPS